MLLAALSFAAERGWIPAVAALAVALGLAIWSYRAAPPGAPRWTCTLLKALGIAVLLLCLLEPLWSTRRARPGANLFAVVADNSQGLQMRDPGATRTRGEQLRELVNPARPGWQEKLGRDFEIRRHFFDSRLQGTTGFQELDFQGNSTALGAALRGLADRYKGRPLAGILLFTDGNATDLGGALPDVTGLPPIYPVMVGRDSPGTDLSLQRVNVTQTAFEDAPVTVEVDVSAAGFRGEPLTARLIDAAGKTVAEERRTPDKAEETLSFRFQHKPEKPGVSFYRVTVRARSEIAEGRESDQTREATLANNSRVVAVDRGEGPYRILYVSGRPNWEFKFLNRALQADDQVQLVGLIRVARREPKFDFRGRAGEDSNPLFRGFGAQSREEVERYDQPVLVRLNAADEKELPKGFPRIPEDLYRYHAVILDDVESAFFSPDQAALLQKFVSERGGGFLMLGGAECFQEGGYHRTPIGDLLPLYLDRPGTGRTGDPVRLQLAREGWLQPWARLRDNEGGEKDRREQMPPFAVANRLREIKPGATVVATATDEAGAEIPALVIQRFGRGRSAALTIGDLWRWGMKNPETRQDLDKTWRQLARWLVADVPRRVEVSVEPAPAGADAGNAVQLQVRVRDPRFAAVDDAAVSLEIEPQLAATPAQAADTNRPPAVRLRAEADAAEPGLYTATFIPRNSGGFRVTARATNQVGAEIGRAIGGWSTDLAAEEFRSLKPNAALLDELARRTGGEQVTPDQLDRLVSALPRRPAPMMEAWSQPLWHTPYLFGLALACFLAEWGVRRWKGLP